ncbi:hypothetical protein QAD02_015235 [Eretmocerus hayati]|uniref:Uncharacterized protein n=1 Tax=Eretmocerus hayati TaxID=131215 RepID=A0ACC2P7P8_9HYME|nr:hypothetical protein QAD02_015235 [Eretmocerus hayati]
MSEIDESKIPLLDKGSYKTPVVLWYQKDNAVYVNIQLLDVEKYYLKVESDLLIFSTHLGGCKYFLGLRLFGAVVAEKTSHQRLGREVKIILIKALKWIDWPRLQESQEKDFHIKQDTEHLGKVSWDNPHADYKDKESFEDYKKRCGISNIPPPPSSDEENSESDDERCIGYD